MLMRQVFDWKNCLSKMVKMGIQDKGNPVSLKQGLIKNTIIIENNSNLDYRTIREMYFDHKILFMSFLIKDILEFPDTFVCPENFMEYTFINQKDRFEVRDEYNELCGTVSKKILEQVFPNLEVFVSGENLWEIIVK